MEADFSAETVQENQVQQSLGIVTDLIIIILIYSTSHSNWTVSLNVIDQ
jgi:hypothetical protein